MSILFVNFLAKPCRDHRNVRLFVMQNQVLLLAIKYISELSFESYESFKIYLAYRVIDLGSVQTTRPTSYLFKYEQRARNDDGSVMRDAGPEAVDFGDDAAVRRHVEDLVQLQRVTVKAVDVHQLLAATSSQQVRAVALARAHLQLRWFGQRFWHDKADVRKKCKNGNDIGSFFYYCTYPT